MLRRIQPGAPSIILNNLPLQTKLGIVKTKKVRNISRNKSSERKTIKYSVNYKPLKRVLGTNLFYSRGFAGFNRSKPHVNIGTIGHVDHRIIISFTA